MRKLLSLLAFILFSGAFAQDFVVNPQGIIVNPSPSFGVDVWLNKSGAEPVYQPGENITISVSPTADAYIYLFNVRSDGEVVQILPNQFDAAGRDNFVRAGQTKVFPPQGGGYNFEVTQPFGLDKVIAVASRDQLNTSTLASFRSGEDFATSNLGESGFVRALGIIVTPVPSSNWVTDTAHFWVGSPPARPTTGTINISSSPSGASAFVNDSYVGTTPISYTTQSGQYTIRVELSGYERHSGTINLSAGQSVNVNANLVPSRQTGTVRFRSTPNGASVWVNNQNLGTTPLNNIVLDVGSYEARFELAGYSSTVVPFRVAANDNQRVEGDLRPLSGSLRVVANVGGARVYLNGSHRGNIPSGSGTLDIGELESGNYELVVIAPGFNTHLSTVRVNAGSRADVRVQQGRR